MKTLLFAILATLAIGAMANEILRLRERANEIFRPLPLTPPVIVNNPANEAKVTLGTMLFFDPRLSRSGTISCSSCHNPGTGGADNVPTSVGYGWQRGRRNAPTVFNSVFNIAQFWDGRALDLKNQAVWPLQAPAEMNNTPARIEATLNSIPEYVDLFGKAFPGEEAPVRFENVARALEMFQSTLITPNAPFDRFLRGEDDAMTEQERRGLRLFIGHGCVTCHRRVNVGGNAFFPFGMMSAPDETVRPPEDRGRFEVTGRTLDLYVFRVAPLRNVALTAPYFHSGRVWELDEAVRVMAKSQFNAVLPDQDVEDIVSFLHTLTGQQPRITHPILPPSNRHTPRPEF